MKRISRILYTNKSTQNTNEIDNIAQAFADFSNKHIENLQYNIDSNFQDEIRKKVATILEMPIPENENIPISDEEIIKALKAARNSSASGLDLISYPNLKKGENSCIEFLEGFFKLAWSTENLLICFK